MNTTTTRARWYPVVSRAVGAVFVAAAVLKGQDFVATPARGGPAVTGGPWALLIQIQFELLVGAWLLCGVIRRAAWTVAVAACCTFLIVAISKAAAGEASCGCFGRVTVSPWGTAAFDLGAASALLASRPPRHDGRRTGSPALRVGALACLAGAAAGSVAWGAYLAAFRFAHRPAADGADGLGAPGGIVLLEPDRWTGGRLPVLPYIDIGLQLGRGDWVILIYHHDCRACQEAIPEYQRAAAAWARDDGRAAGPRLALVELPPYAGGGAGAAGPPSSGWTAGKLSNDREWFAATPVVLALRDANVLRAAQGGDAKDPDVVLRAFAPGSGGAAAPKSAALLVTGGPPP